MGVVAGIVVVSMGVGALGALIYFGVRKLDKDI